MTDRLADKDAADIYRIMQPARPRDVALTLNQLSGDPVAGPTTLAAMAYLREQFGTRSSAGVRMAQRALVTVVDENEIATLYHIRRPIRVVS